MKLRDCVFNSMVAVAMCACGWRSAKADTTPRPLKLPIHFTLHQAGQVSLAVYDAIGRMVRPIFYGQPHATGDFTANWDGLDRYGDPLPPGDYEWRLLRTPGFSRELAVNLGINTPWSPYDVWPGNHFGPSFVMVDNDGALFVGSYSSEGPPHLLKMALDGSKKYWDDGTWGMADGLMGMAHIGNVLFMLKGEKVDWSNGHDRALDVRRAENGWQCYGVPGLRRFAEKRIPFASLVHAGDDPAAKKLSPMHMAGGRDFLAVTYRDYNEVRFLWPEEDHFAREKIVAVPEPRAVTVATDGRVFVTSGNNLVRVDPESGQVTMVVRDVPAAGKLAHDPKFDDLLVVSADKDPIGGERSVGKCIRRFHVADGKPVAVYGRPQGRTYGLFNPLDFDDILDITADRKGGFVMVEQYPRRVAHFSGREKHELVNQWVGGMQWGSVATIDPADPTIAYVPIDPKHMGRAKIDYKLKSWTLTHLYDQCDHAAWSLGGAFRHQDILPLYSERNFWEVRHVAGKTFLVNRGAGMAGGSVTVLRVDDVANRLLPVAHLGGLNPTESERNPQEWWLAALKRMGVDAKPGAGREGFESRGGFKHINYSWSDTNQNGKVDMEEIMLSSNGGRAGSYSCAVDANWNVLVPSNGNFAKTGDAWILVPNEGTQELPVWNWDHARPGDGHYAEHEQTVIQPEVFSIYRDQQGATYAVVNGMGVDDAPVKNWPNNICHASRFLKWDVQGRPAFSTGVHTVRKDGLPGQFAHVRAILGEAKDCLVVMDACQAASVWTRDGLYAGAFNDDVNIPAELSATVKGQPPTWQARAYLKVTHDDNAWGQVVTTGSGDVLWGVMRDNNTAYYRIGGFDGWERQQGKLSLKAPPPAALRKGDGLKAEYFASTDLSGKPLLERIDPTIWFGPMHGAFREVKTLNSWLRKDDAAALPAADGFSARWTGFVEAPLTEEFVFTLYAYAAQQDDPKDKQPGGARVRAWIDGKLMIDSWDQIKLKRSRQMNHSRDLNTAPIALQAGQRVAIKIEFASPGGADAHLHLYWASPSSDPRHIPRELLYSGSAR